MKKIILILILILNLFLNEKNLVKSDITSPDEINSLWWLSVQYGFAWDLSSGKICSNIGIVCDSTLKHVVELNIDTNIPSGAVIPPYGSTTTTTTTGSTTTSSPTSSTPTSDDGSSTYTSSSSSSSSTTFQTTLTPTTVVSEDPVILTVLEVKYQSLNLRKLMNRLQSTPDNINYLVFPSLTSLKIKSRNSISGVNVYAYISNLPLLNYLEITDISNLNEIPTDFIYFCPNLVTLIIKNIPTTIIPDSLLFTNGAPLNKVVLDFEISSFTWTQTNAIKDLLINFNSGSTFTIDGFNWQKLEQLTIKTQSSFIIINMLVLKQVSVICPSGSPSNLYKWENNENIDSIQFNYCGIGIMGLRFLNTNLTSLTILDGYVASSVPISPYPPNLEVLRIERSSFDQLPNRYSLPNLKQLIIPENLQAGPLDSYSTLNKINVSTNSFSGSIPQELCYVAEIDLSKNQFSSIPDCFLCHWSLTSNWLNGNSIDLSNSSFVCDIQLDETTFNVINIGDVITLTGKNLGWINSVSTTSLQMIIPNTQFTYTIPPKTLGITSQLIKFSSDHSFLINWTYFTLEITNVVFTQTSTNVLVNISGLFDSTSVIYLNSVQYPNPTFFSNTTIQIQLPITYSEGPVDVLLKNSKTNSTFKSVFKHVYPSISSASIVSKTDSQITIYGNFYKNSTTNNSGSAAGNTALLRATSTSETGITVKINDSPCTVISFTTSMIVIGDLPQFSQGGYALLSVENNGYVFTSSKLVFFEQQKDTSICSETCENGGACVDSKCKCINDYYGPTCKLLKASAESYTITTDQTKPSATYSLEKVAFEFSLYSIQELNFENDVVQTKQVTSWEYQADKMINNLGVGSVYTSNLGDNGAIVSVSVFIPTSSLEYQFAGVTMNLESGQVKVSMNISNWQYQSSLNTIRAVFKSKSTNNIENKDDQCQSTDGKVNSQTDTEYNTLQSFTISRNGGVLYGSFIDRMLSNGRISYSKVEDLGLDSTDSSISYAAINMPQCVECLLDPDYSILVDPSFSTQDGCGSSKSKSWVIPVAVVIPIVAVTALGVVGYVVFKKHFMFARDGKSFKLTNRRKSKSNFNMKKF